MLAIHGKKTEAVDLKTPLISYVRNTYSDREADDAADDLNMVQQLRAEMANMVAHPSSREIFCRYLRCLTAIETRFPISKEKGHAQLAFTWSDAFRPRNKLSQTNIHYEKAAVLFNLGAILSQQALACDRQSTEGLTLACKGFQEAAGVFQHLRESESNKMDSPGSVDVGAECAAMLERLMLAQAQECVYHRACLGATLPQTLARIAKQTHAMYADAERSFSSPLLKDHFDKGWASHVQLKGSVFDIESLTQSAKFLHTEQRVNVEIAVLQEAFKRLQSTKKFASAVSADALASVAAIQESVQFALTKAEKDNSTVYLMRVPLFAEAPAISGALLVKASRPAGLDSGEPLFTGLVPDGWVIISHGSLRCVLVSPCRQILSEIGELGRNVEEELSKSAGSLEVDARLDNEMRTLFNEKWRCQPSATMAKPYWDTIASYRASLKKAYDSDVGVIKRLADDEAAFAGLSITACAKQMPRLQAPMVATGPEDPAMVVANLRRLMGGLQGSASERAGMEEAMKEMKKGDNVLPKLMASAPQMYDALFASELQKYNPLVADVDKNVKAQTDLLGALEQENRLFRSIFDVDGWHAACVGSAAGLRESAKSFRGLLDHISEGLRFYIGMADVVGRARQECNDFAFTRQPMSPMLEVSHRLSLDRLVSPTITSIRHQLSFHPRSTSLAPAWLDPGARSSSQLPACNNHSAGPIRPARRAEAGAGAPGLPRGGGAAHPPDGRHRPLPVQRQQRPRPTPQQHLPPHLMYGQQPAPPAPPSQHPQYHHPVGTPTAVPPPPPPPTQQPPPYYQPQQPQQPPYSSPPGPQPHYGYSVPVPPPPGQQQQQQQQQYPPQQQYGAPPNPYQAYSQQAPPPPPPPPPSTYITTTTTGAPPPPGHPPSGPFF
ncbi:MAG: hypothetical protein WDW38_001981 [Sanguina aurantia]